MVSHLIMINCLLPKFHTNVFASLVFAHFDITTPLTFFLGLNSTFHCQFFIFIHLFIDKWMFLLLLLTGKEEMLWPPPPPPEYEKIFMASKFWKNYKYWLYYHCSVCVLNPVTERYFFKKKERRKKKIRFRVGHNSMHRNCCFSTSRLWHDLKQNF